MAVEQGGDYLSPKWRAQVEKDRRIPLKPMTSEEVRARQVRAILALGGNPYVRSQVNKSN